MKIKYIEQYSTCIFFARICSYTIIGSDDDLIDKIWVKLIPLTRKYDFFEDNSKATKLSIFLEKKFVSISWIFKIAPFLTPLWTKNPRKMYQKWCETWNDFFTEEEKRKIIDEDIAKGSERVFWGETLWILMSMQKNYIPVLFEIEHLLRKD